jgi:hypothetical protein
LDKRYQVFTSSTFTDLKEERQTALKAILELGHMPAGMELFPATDDSAWQLIKDVIDASDYYVLIVGGRYGSLDEEGLGFTEKEYNYAVTSKKPVIALLHSNPNSLPRSKTDGSDSAWKKLEAFRSRVENKHTCVYWNSADDLKAKLIVGLTTETKRHPSVGWVRADNVPDNATIADILALRNKVAELEAQLKKQAEGPPPGTEDLVQGDELFTFNVSFQSSGTKATPNVAFNWTARITATWDQIFAAVAPALIHEATDYELRRSFREFLQRRGSENFAKDKDLMGFALTRWNVRDEDQLTTCIVQLRALNLIQESQRKRSVHDKGVYWTLTAYGDRRMVQLRALKRTPPPIPPTIEKVADQKK